ncbi:MAG: hypothetical protein FWE87_05885, partial [Coriobacteriia bacterium]|nr:hypothetical protein [Coriobacteriia bacterium]
LSFSFSVRGEFEGPDCFACHETIMIYHEFSSCDPCHGEDSPFGGGFSDSFGSPHGDATGSCINSDCHAGILDPSLNNELLTTCDGCHTGVVNEVHHARAIENPSCIGCHAYGTPEGSKTCKSCHVESLMAVHHAADDAGSMCADCHADIIAQANPVRLSLTFSNTTNNLRRALMTHLVTPATEGTGDPWLDNGDPATRGSKCVDCHNIAQTAVGDPLAGAVGYVPDYSGVGNFGEVTNFTAVELGNDTGVNSAYLCVKCHGGPASAAGTTKVLNTNITSNTTGNGNGDNFNYRRGDIAKEFNPANASGHRVFGGEVQVKFQNVVGVRGWYGAPGATGGPTVASGFQPPGIPGTNVDDPLVETTVFPELRMPIWSMTTWFKGTDSNGNPWAYNSQMTCTDCHTALASNELSGPHGANIKYGLDPNYQVDWKFSTPTNQMNITAANQVTAANNKTQIVCWKCHDLLAVYNGAHGNTHAQSNHRGRNCVACHTAIPHGSTRPRLLSEWYRDEQQYTSRQYGVAIGSASINIINLGQLNTTAINGYNDAQLISTRYGWSSGASANCTRGCNTHGSPGAAQWYWE